MHDARIVEDTMHSEQVDECILEEASGWLFDSASSPTDIGSYPFKFGVITPDAGK